MIKLNYKNITFNGINILYARYRKNRNIRLVIENSSTVKLTCPYYATEYDIIRFLEEKESWIRDTLSKVNNKISLASKPRLKTIEKRYLYNKIKYFVEKYEILLCTSVKRFSLRKMKTLWGSCSYQDRTIRFNSLLYYMSDSFTEYIVLHEMAHLFVHNHSKDFYKIITKFMPNYKKIWSEHKKVALT